VPRTLVMKVVPPPIAEAFVRRGALHARLAGVMTHRLTTVIGAAGFGKSTLLAAWAAGVAMAWYSLDAADADLATFSRGLVDALRLRLPGLASEVVAAADVSLGPDAEERARAEALGALLCDAVQPQLGFDLALILDDVHEIGPGTPSARLIEGLVRHAPPSLHLVLASRTDPPFGIERLRGQGQVLEIGPGGLGFTPEEVSELLRVCLDHGADHLASRLYEVTSGWPAAVRLAIEALRTGRPEDRGAILSRLKRPEGPLFAYLAEEVFAREPAAVREVIRLAAPFERFNASLLEAVGARQPAEVLGGLARRGLFVETVSTLEGWYTLGPLVREFALQRLSLPQREVEEVHRRAAAWFQSHGQWVEALRSLAAAKDHASMEKVLAEEGFGMLASGQVEAIIWATNLLREDLRGPVIDQLAGQALQIRGDWQGAVACFRRAAGDAPILPAGVAWRMGLMHYLRGQLDEALQTFARGRVDGSELEDEAQILAWTATVHWVKGDAESCRRESARALEVATASGSDHALAAAHTVLAMLAALDGDRLGNDAHYLWALSAAERAHDVLQIIRIRTNRASHFSEEGDYEQALGELEISIRLAELTGYANFLALGLGNRGHALLRLGRLEEAIADFEASRLVYQRLGSRNLCYALDGLGTVYRERGDLVLAQAAFEQGLALAREAGNAQGIVPNMIGLARVTVAEDPEGAAALAERAMREARPGLDFVSARLAAGWIALARGDNDRASGFAAESAATARLRRDRAGLAEALELHAASSADPQAAAARLEEATSIWRAIGNRLGRARSELALAKLSTDGSKRAAAERAEGELRALGVHMDTAAAGLLGTLAGRGQAPISIQTLGAFLVFRGGRPVLTAEWRSRKARALLKILVARRGKPTHREFLMETLWPDEDPTKLANRLSVALTTVRATLDPVHHYEAEQFVVGDAETVALNPANVSVDVERFLADAQVGLDLLRGGRAEEAAPFLARAEAAYAGDFLEEDSYEDWAVPLREEARATYISVARALARMAAQNGDQDAAIRYHLRILERDVYDEGAYLGVVSTLALAGRHGEARRWYRSYAGRMEELGAEAAPFPTASG
jgi:ATP/maltotriose-dependent transcriptional regulator MalT